MYDSFHRKLIDKLGDGEASSPLEKDIDGTHGRRLTPAICGLGALNSNAQSIKEVYVALKEEFIPLNGPISSVGHCDLLFMTQEKWICEQTITLGRMVV